jgi:hypothetical protein
VDGIHRVFYQRILTTPAVGLREGKNGTSERSSITVKL